MSQRLGLITCSHFEREVRALSHHPDFSDVQFMTHPVHCDQFEAKWTDLRKAIDVARNKDLPVCLVGSFCLSQAVKEMEVKESCPAIQKSLCFEWLADKDLLDHFLQEGAFLLLPGWLENWKRYVEEKWGSDRKAAQEFFRGASKKLVLLDTGVRPKIEAVLSDLARFVRMPSEVYPVGLGFLKLNLIQTVLSRRLEDNRRAADDRIEEIRRKISGYSRFGHLFGVLNRAQSEEEVLSGVSEVLNSLLSPRVVDFRPASSFSEAQRSEDSSLDRIFTLNADHVWTADRSGLLLRVAVDGEVFGILEVSGFPSDETRDNALGISLAAAAVAGLAMGNVRTLRSLRKEREKAQSIEEALRISEEKRRTVFENVPLGIYRTTVSGEIIDANPALARMLGYPDTATLKKVNCRDLYLNPGDRDLWKSLMETSGFIENFETQFRRQDGTIIWVKDSAQGMKDGNGRSLYFDGILEDISKRKQTETSLSWTWRMKTALAELSQRLLKPTTIEEMSSLVLEHARRLTGSRTGFVGYVEQESGRIRPSAMTSDAQEMLDRHPEMTWKAHDASELWGWVRRTQKPILSNLPSLDPRYRGLPDWHLQVSQFLAVPAVMDDELVGLITLANSERMYCEQDLEVMERLAALYAITVHRARTEERLRELSLEDELTQLYNRRGFLTLAEQQLKIANRTKKDMVLLYADLDDLKRINDTLGHGAGDRAIIEVAAILKEAFRESDIIARIGGDEFAVLAIDIQGMKPAAIVKRITDNIETWNGRTGRSFPLSLSLGIAVYSPVKPCSVHELLTAADRRMYEDKTAKKVQLSS